MMDCKRALQENNYDIDAAIDHLREKGKARAAKKAGREAKEGLVYSYIHPGERLGVLLEINCETDFVARTEEFQNLVSETAMQIAATDPRWIKPDDVAQDDIDREKEIFRKQLEEEGKAGEIVEKIITGKMKKFYSENCLLEQPYIRDDKKAVKDLVQEVIAKLGENIQISRFCRFEIGK